MSASRRNRNTLRWLAAVALLFFIAVQVYDLSSSDGRVRSIIMSLGLTVTTFAIASGALAKGNHDGIGFASKIFMVLGIVVMVLAIMFVDGRLRIAFV